MGEGNWFRRSRRRTPGSKLSGGAAKRGGKARGLSLRRPMSLEHLEDRRLLVNYLVSSPGDVDGGGNAIFGSLRWALNQANASDVADAIVFAENLTAITLNGGQLNIESPVQILGPGPRKLTIAQGQGNRRIFNIDIGDDDEYFNVQISGVTLTGGNLAGTGDDQRGGAIFNRERLTMVEAVVDGNSASQGGGGIFVERGALTLSRSSVVNNSAGLVGGGMMIGTDDEEVNPTATIIDSTISGNSASGGNDTYPMSYGGGVFLRTRGAVTIMSSTIVFNNADVGGGVASWGIPVEDSENPPPPPDRNQFIRSSIVWGNLADDVAVVGFNDDEPPLPNFPLLDSAGFNIIGVFTGDIMRNADDLAAATDPDFINTLDLNGDGNPDPENFGGSTDVYMPSDTSDALDAGAPDVATLHEQRGRHYSRIFDYTGAGATADVGSTERQAVSFVVDELFDESPLEGQHSGVYDLVDLILGVIVVPPFPYETEGDFTIREALDFAILNTDPATISFSPSLRGREFEDDPQAVPSPATIALTLGPLFIGTPTTMIGPTTFILEIDASGNDLTPQTNDGNGTRVFEISAPTQISNLTIMGGDTNAAGGGAGIVTNSDLTLIDVTLKDNFISGNGGAVSALGSSLTVIGSTFKKNTSSVNGGALFLDGGTVSIVNSTFSGNVANGRGGAIANNNADATIEFSTITLNTASTTRGSGIWTLNGAAANTAVRGSIISGNSINDVEFAPGANGKIESLGFNLVGVGNAASLFNEMGDQAGITNPMLGPLIITGGQTETHRPLIGSPIIDAGDPNFDPNAFTPPLDTDQRGGDYVRVFDGDGVGGARIDVGAYELQSSEFIVSSSGDDNDGDYTFGFLTLREAIILANENPLLDKITFDPSVTSGGFIGVDGLLLAISDAADLQIKTSMSIEGPGSDDLTVSGAGLSHPLIPLQGPKRLFTIDDGNPLTTIDVSISGLSIVGGASGQAGGAIMSTENLTLDDVSLVNNSTLLWDPLLTGLVTGGIHGGAIYQKGAALTINNSVLTGNFTDANDSDGGGLYAADANVTIFYTTITGNRTLQGSSEGGGVVFKNSTVVATEVTITGNSTFAGLSDGGGAFINNSTVLFEESAIAGNSTAGSNSEGGAIAVTGAASSVGIEKNTTLTFNSTTGTGSSGGGAFIGGGTLNINNSVIVGNSTSGPGASGGGVAVGAGGSLLIAGTRVHENVTNGSGSQGGGVANLSGNVTIRNSTLSANKAKHSQSKGGGVYSDTNLAGSQTTAIVNSTISGNSAGLRGGGVFNADGRTDIKHATITNNSTPFFNAGNGVGSQGNAATLTTVQSSIIAGNVGTAAGTGTDVDFIDTPFLNSFQSLGYNVVGAGNALAKFNQTGDKISILNPLLGPLASNGGLTQTHAVLTGSAAINAGNPAFNPNAFTPALTTDQRGVGFARVQGGRIDAGAYESSFSGLTADFDADGAVDGFDFLHWQLNLGKPNPTQADGDANGDGAINGGDLTEWRSQYGAATSEAAAAPASASGGSDAPAPQAALASVETPPAETAASGDVAAIAGSGTPGAATSVRTAYRPTVERRAEVRVAAVSRSAAFADWTPADDDSLTHAVRACLDAADEGNEHDLSGEDAVFSLLGEGAL